jgi:hypothetical protein
LAIGPLLSTNDFESDQSEPGQENNWVPSLALQLHILSDMGVLCGGLMGSSPERPGDDVSGFDASLGEPNRDPSDFLDRPADQ